jgi:putative SOS response-associated peptidase YedK
MCYSVMVETDLKRLTELTGASLDLDGLLEILTQYSILGANPSAGQGLDLPLRGTLKIPPGFKNSLAELVDLAQHSPLNSRDKALAEQCLERWSQLDQVTTRHLIEKKELQEKKLSSLRDLAAQKPTKTNVSRMESAQRVLDKIRSDLGLDCPVNNSTPRDKIDSAEARKKKSYGTSVFQYSWTPLLLDDPQKGKILRFHRYQVRPRGSLAEPPAHLNMFNARLDSLTTRPTWRPLFMSQHGALYLRGFYEWVPDPETQKSRIIRFSREDQKPFWVPCLYERWQSRWSQGDFTIPSFAIVTTEPPEEVLKAGHDRCPLVPDQSNISLWLKAEDGALISQELQKPHAVRFVHEWAKP